MQANATKVQKRLRGKARQPAQQAADVVEQVLRTDGEDYLQTQQHKLPWWRLSLLDVKLFLVLSALVILGCIAVLAWLIIQSSKSFRRKISAAWAAVLDNSQVQRKLKPKSM